MAGRDYPLYQPEATEIVPAHLPPIFSAYGVAMALRQIANRGQVLPGENIVFLAAASLLDRAHREGVL